ncbi:MAG: TonB-dependent receptor [Bacteroidales bacterium]|nr:TonB-dependent receptor [Bacteroidales bacterium]
MRKLLFILLGMLFCWMPLMAQSGMQIKLQAKASIKGIVVEEDGSPVMYASVVAIASGKVLGGVMTDTTGAFKMDIGKVGKYSLKISSIGYNDVSMEIDRSSGGALDLGRIVMSLNTLALDGVVVSAEAASRSVSVEKTRISPQSSASAATGSVLEVIRGSSSVSVDGNDNVSIRGNSNVLILVDGVPTTLGGLGSIPLANVQSIDIITSPDVKYDSEGTGGIISIVSKKQLANAFTSMASFNYGFNNFLNGNLALAYNEGRWGFRFNFNGRYERDEIESELHRRIKQSGRVVDQIIEATKKTANYNIGANISFKATERDILTLDFKAIYPRLNNFQDFNRFRQTDITFNRETYEGSLSYRHIIVPDKKELNLSASVSSITGHRPSYYYEGGSMVQKSVSGGHPFNSSLQADYMTALGKGKFETGVKMTYRQNNIDHKMYEYNPQTGEWELSIPLSNDLKHREYIPAAYAMYSSKLSKKLSLKAGLRFEYSYVTLRNNKDKLDDHSDCFFLAPNLVFNWKISAPWSMTFALSRRISRPTYPQLNPYINLIDNQTYETGNVNLSPEKANKLDIGYSFAGGKVLINGNAYLNYTQDYINQHAYLENDILIFTYMNDDYFLSAGIDHNFKFNFLKWFSLDLASNTYFVKSQGSFKGAEIRNSGWVNNSNIGLNFKPVKGMNLQAQYFLTTPQYLPQFTTSRIHYCNISVKQSFLKNSLTVSALLTDVFNTRRWDIHSNNNIYSLENISRNLSRMLWIGISWNFNSFKPLKNAGRKQEEDRSVIRLGD